MTKAKFKKIALRGAILTSLLFFCSFWFLDKPLKITSITEHLNDPMLYLCMLISILGGYLANVVPYRKNWKN